SQAAARAGAPGSLASTIRNGLPCCRAQCRARVVPIEAGKPLPSVMKRVASLSRTFHSVRCRGCDNSVSFSCGYLANRPGGWGKSLAPPSLGHPPPTVGAATEGGVRRGAVAAALPAADDLHAGMMAEPARNTIAGRIASASSDPAAGRLAAAQFANDARRE